MKFKWLKKNIKSVFSIFASLLPAVLIRREISA